MLDSEYSNETVPYLCEQNLLEFASACDGSNYDQERNHLPDVRGKAKAKTESRDLIVKNRIAVHEWYCELWWQ